MVKFGTGGWRAIIGEEFTKENIQIQKVWSSVMTAVSFPKRL